MTFFAMKKIKIMLMTLIFAASAASASARCYTTQVCGADGCRLEDTCTSESEQSERNDWRDYNRQRGYSDNDPRGSRSYRQGRAREQREYEDER